MDDKNKQRLELIEELSKKGMTSSEGQSIGFTNDGEMYVKNRAARRKKIRLFPKSSQLRKKKSRKK